MTICSPYCRLFLRNGPKRWAHAMIAQSCCCCFFLCLTLLVQVGSFQPPSSTIWANLTSWVIQFNPEIRPAKGEENSLSNGEKSFEFIIWSSKWLKTCGMWWTLASLSSAFPALQSLCFHKNAIQPEVVAVESMLQEDKWKETSLK